jgi:hypothetical protein
MLPRKTIKDYVYAGNALPNNLKNLPINLFAPVFYSTAFINNTLYFIIIIKKAYSSAVSL